MWFPERLLIGSEPEFVAPLSHHHHQQHRLVAHTHRRATGYIPERAVTPHPHIPPITCYATAGSNCRGDVLAFYNAQLLHALVRVLAFFFNSEQLHCILCLLILKCIIYYFIKPNKCWYRNNDYVI